MTAEYRELERRPGEDDGAWLDRTLPLKRDVARREGAGEYRVQP